MMTVGVPFRRIYCTDKYNRVAQVICLKETLQRRIIPTSGLKRFREFRPVGIGQFFVIKMPRMNLGMKLL